MDTGFAVFPFADGYIRVDWASGAVTGLSWLGTECRDFGTATALTERVREQFHEYFAGERREFDFPFEFYGTPFQEKVWRALLTIPYGETRSYGQIAAQIGSPKASRAVGMANNRNPLLIVVPCHRVIGADGSLTGYACGLDLKRRLLELEQAHK